MKRFLLSLAAILVLIAGKSQATLNEVSINPGNDAGFFGPLSSTPSAVKLTSFSGSLNSDKVTLTWAVASNETTDRFEIERSIDGVNFITAALVFTSEKSGAQSYSIHENIVMNGKVYYRLKIYDNNQSVRYSKVLLFQEVSKTFMF
jgi:hypothetical protein